MSNDKTGAAGHQSLKNAPILILDEATASVDNATEMLIQDALQRLMAGRASFVIAHRLSTVRRADQILVLHAGKIAECGSHEQLLAAGGLYAMLSQGPREVGQPVLFETAESRGAVKG